MRDIILKAEDGFIKFRNLTIIEIKSSNLSVIRKVNFNLEILSKFFQEIENSFLLNDNEFDIIYLVSLDKLLGIEARCTSTDKNIHFIGEYRENKKDVNTIEFELLINKDSIKEAISGYKNASTQNYTKPLTKL